MYMIEEEYVTTDNEGFRNESYRVPVIKAFKFLAEKYVKERMALYHELGYERLTEPEHPTQMLKKKLFEDGNTVQYVHIWIQKV